MDYFWHTVGHTRIKRVLEKQLESASVPQGYIWTGPEGVGKKMLAQEMAKRLAPEVGAVLEYSFDGADVETVRGWVAQLSLKPVAGASQVAIFDAAESITIASANVLLKPLEEPAVGTYVIFIASRGGLPATVLSRCQELHFGKLASQELEQIANSWEQPATSGAVAAADGSASRLKALLSGEESASQIAEWNNDFASVSSGSEFDRLKLAARLSGEEPEVLQERFKHWMSLAAGKYDKPSSSAALLEGWKRLGLHANKKLVLEYVCLNI